MFSNAPSDKKPSLLTLANRASEATRRENAAELSGTTQAAAEDGRESEIEAGKSGSSIWNTLKEYRKLAGGKSDYEEAIASIENDVDALVSEEAIAHQSYAYADHDAFRPLINPVIVVRAIWRWRWPIVATTFLGGVAGVLIALSTPHVYTAYSQVLIDPRQINLVERDLTPEFLGTESALAIVDSQLATVFSTPVLLRVIDKLNLNQDSEFNGSDDDGLGLFNGIAFVRSLFSADTPIDINDRVTIENLRDAIDAERNSSTFVFWISADSQNPQLAAKIANAVTESFIENQIERESLAARTASSALGSQLVKLKAAVEDAERKAEVFAQANNLTRVGGLTLTDNQLVATSSQLSDAKAATIRAKSIAEAAQLANVDSVVSGALPPELVNSALTTFRAQFSSLNQNAAALEQALGPRHPRLATAIAARESARGEIAAELQRIIAGTQADLRRAIRNEQQIAAALAQTRAEQGQSGEALITLRELESEIEAAQAIYKGALLRSRETNQLESLVSVNATIISEAETPLYASSVSRKFIAMSGAMTGLFIGIGAAFIAGLRDCVQANKNAPRRGPSPIGGNYAAARRQSYGDAAPAQPHPGFAPQMAPVSATGIYAEAPSYYPYGHPMQPYSEMPPHVDPYGQPHPAAQAKAPIQQQSPDQPHYDEPGFSLDEEMEMEELRASVQEIRVVLDHLTQTRGARQRFG